MNLQEYKKQIKDLEDRLNKLQKEYDRQTVIFDETMKNLFQYGIENADEIDSKIAELEAEIEKAQGKLDTYLSSFDKKLQDVEALLK